MPEDILSKLNASTEDENIESKLDEGKKALRIMMNWKTS